MNTEDLKAGMEVFTRVVVEEVDRNIVRVHTLNESGAADVSFWLLTDEVLPVQEVKKVLKFSVGDEVIHRDYPALGIGTIKRTGCFEKIYNMEIGKDGIFYTIPNLLSADYEINWEFIPGSRNSSVTTGWLHAEEFLLPARRKMD